MGTYTFKLPDIGEGIAEAEIVAWHVKIGDVVEEDDPLADLMTDKATVEMTAPIAGKVVSLAGEVGDMVPIASNLVVFKTDDAVTGAQTNIAAAQGTESTHDHEASRTALIADDPEPSPREGEAAPTTVKERVRLLASPAVRSRARDLGIDLAEVWSADKGRLRHSDLDAYLSYNGARGFAPAGRARADEQIRVVGLRRRIAENMAAAKRSIPHFTLVEEIDVTKLEELRADLNVTRGIKPKLTILPLLITAVCRALLDHPMINARYDDERGVVTRHGAVHMGIATQTDRGLMVPVIRGAQGRNIWQLAAEIVRLANAARSGKASSDELSGSTLTITSLGALGGIATTPVINRPEVAILGPNKVIERPVVKDGVIVIAKLMNLSISCDHRVVDGWDAANFVQAVRRLLETPALLFGD